MAKRVLILSDDEKSLARLSRFLADEGYEVKSRLVNEDMLVAATGYQPAAIVLDSRQDWGTIVPMIEDLKRESELRDAAIVVATQEGAAVQHLSRLAVANLHVVHRPVDRVELIGILRRTIGSAD